MHCIRAFDAISGVCDGAGVSTPDLNLLITLNVLLAEGSVARAAQRLRLSPSAMSRALARLRETTGDPLLVRAGRGLVPTPRALELRERVEQLVQDAEAVLRTGASARPCRNWFVRSRSARAKALWKNFGAGLIAHVGAQAPGVRLRFVQKPNRDTSPLRDGDGRSGTGVVGKATSPELHVQALFRDRFVGVVRAGHPLCDGEISAARYASGAHIGTFAARPRTRRDRRRVASHRTRTAHRHDRRRLYHRAGAGARVRPRRQRAGAPYRQPARRHAQLCAAGRRTAVHGVDAMASAAACGPGASLAARLRARGLRGAKRRYFASAEAPRERTHPAPTDASNLDDLCQERRRPLRLEPRPHDRVLSRHDGAGRHAHGRRRRRARKRRHAARAARDTAGDRRDDSHRRPAGRA